MLFHEIYGCYFNVVAAVLREVCKEPITDKRISEIIMDKAFDESILEIPAALKSSWCLLTSERQTTLKYPPVMPLTLLQKRWLKALLCDPRIKLFGVTDEGLSDVEPLYLPEDVYYYDRYFDGDPFEDEGYVTRFRSILYALEQKHMLVVSYTGRDGVNYDRNCFPFHLEYSSKDNKFRLIAAYGDETITINLGRVTSVEPGDRLDGDEPEYRTDTRQFVFTAELMDERNAMERAMLHFSNLKKETVRLDENRYKMTVYYDRDDEAELLIRVLAFGPLLRVTSPERFTKLIRERLVKQKKL